jgi:hypothetical protein
MGVCIAFADSGERSCVLTFFRLDDRRETGLSELNLEAINESSYEKAMVFTLADSIGASTRALEDIRMSAHNASAFICV